jgi:hypothetical protein
MVKSAQFTKSLANGIDIQFSRGSVENKMPEEPYYDVAVLRKEEKHSLRMKKNNNGYWGIEDRVHLPLWVRDLEPEFIKAVRQNEA